MRYLNRIIFINSARVRYTEVNLNGNVHFIGTQGVGKSTLLRAILFFYNADTLGLGISRQKQSYVDYYFKDANAYIVYEVVRDDTVFCVVSYKSQHKVCFRFFDGEYRQEYFIKENGNVPESWEGVAERLDRNNIYYTKRKIDEYSTYRDIIYGNNRGLKNEYKRYSIIESKEYQYIPKTIQNVFLNSKMEADFIKQTIIMSLDNDVRIDLNQYAHHLNDFDKQLTDIRKFKYPSSITQADNISKLYVAIRGLEREKQQTIELLGKEIYKNEQLEPELKEKLEREKIQKSGLNEALQKTTDSYMAKEDKIKGDIRIQEENLRKVRELNIKYREKNIENLIERVEKRGSIEKELQNLYSEKDLLTSQFSEINRKYQALLEQADNQWKEYRNMKEADKNRFRSEFLDFQTNIRNQYEKKLSEIREEYKSALDEETERLDQKRIFTNNLKIEKERVTHTRFLENDIQQNASSLLSYTRLNEKLKAANEQAARETESLRKNWDFEQKELEGKNDRVVEKLNEQISILNKQIDEITFYIDNSKDSLYGWLTENYHGWEKTIGKVIDEKVVLFNSNLSPKMNKSNNTVYGVELDLEEVDKIVKTMDDYEREKSGLKEKTDELRREINNTHQTLEKNKENLKRKFQPKIREQNELIRRNEYSIEQNEQKKSQALVKEKQLESWAEQEKQAALDNLKIKIENAVNEELLVKEKINAIEEEESKQTKKIGRERDRKIKAEDERVNLQVTQIENEIDAEGEQVNIRKKEIGLQQENDLLSKGADTKRLSEIESETVLLNEELHFIEKNRDIVAEYRKDKREYIDRIDEFKQSKQKSERQLVSEKEKHEQLVEKITYDLDLVDQQIDQATDILKNIYEDNEALHNFKELEFYKSIAGSLESAIEEAKTVEKSVDTKFQDKSVKELIDRLKDIQYDKLTGRMNELRQTTTDFIAKFSDDNIFKFKKQLTDDSSFLDFAIMLSDFVEENKIGTIEKEVNERFSWIISTIAKQTTNLVEKSGEIQKVISKINDDFDKKNFMGVIKKIELKVDDSRNELVQILIQIKKHYDENPFAVGETNLFSGENQAKSNKKAVELLNQFTGKIGELKSDYITLADSFELKFRIVENDNDSGWVEKLSNVGSDGTDVLVKAMLNIMLLNVFKEGASRRFKDFKLHCMMDEIGKLHPNNVRGILKFANDRGIWLISGSPIENDALAFDHIYKLSKDNHSITRVKRIVTQYHHT